MWFKIDQGEFIIYLLMYGSFDLLLFKYENSTNELLITYNSQSYRSVFHSSFLLQNTL